MAQQEISVYKAGSGNPIPSIVVDAVFSEDHTAENMVTEQTLEDGSIDSDHIVIRPDIVEISLEVSNFDGDGKNSKGERAKTAWQQLKILRARREVLTITTQHEIYENMAIVSISGSVVAPFSGRILLTCRFQKIDVTKLTALDSPASNLAGGTSPFSGRGGPVSLSGSGKIDSGSVDPVQQFQDPELFDTIARKILERSVAVLKGETTIEQETVDAIAGAFELLPFESDGARKFLTNMVVGVARAIIYETSYNYQIGSWSLDLFTSDNEPIVLGRIITPGTSMLEGLPDLQRDVGDLVVVDLRDDVRNEGSPDDLTLGTLPDSDYVVASFPPGAWSEIKSAYLIPRVRPLNFDLFNSGWTLA